MNEMDEGSLPCSEPSAGGPGECYACMVGVWTGPESHDEFCPFRKKTPKGNGVRHVVRTGIVRGRQSWECSCGRGGSVGEFGYVELASDKHIRYENGDMRSDSSASFDDPWPKAASEASTETPLP